MTRHRFTLTLAIGLVCHALSPASGRAQTRVDADVTVAWPYVFRGQVLATNPTIQPRAWITGGIPNVAVSLGAWSLVEPFAPVARDFSLRARGSPVSQWDLWADVTTRFLGQDLTAGATRYHFVNSPLAGLRTSPYAELYVAAERPSDTPLAEAWWYRVRFWQGIAGANTRFLEASLGPQLYVVPLRDLSLSVTGGVGFNLSAATPASERPGTFYERGLVYYDLAATAVSMPQCYEGRDVKLTERALDLLTPRQIMFRIQLGRDSTTRLVRRSGPEKKAIAVLEAVWAPRHCARAR